VHCSRKQFRSWVTVTIFLMTEISCIASQFVFVVFITVDHPWNMCFIWLDLYCIIKLTYVSAIIFYLAYKTWCLVFFFFNRDILMTLSDLGRSHLVHSLRWVPYAVPKKVISHIRSFSVSLNWLLLLLLCMLPMSSNVWMLKK